MIVGYFITSYPTRAHGIIVKYTQTTINCMQTGKTHEAVDSDLMSQDDRQLLAWYRIIFSLQLPENFQSLSINPRNIDAANSDRALYIDNPEIKKTEQTKLLGVYIDENLNFAGHIGYLCTRTSYRLQNRPFFEILQRGDQGKIAQKVGRTRRLQIKVFVSVSLKFPEKWRKERSRKVDTT